MTSRPSSRPSLVLGLALGGVLLGHTVAYLLLLPDAHTRALELRAAGDEGRPAPPPAMAQPVRGAARRPSRAAPSLPHRLAAGPRSTVVLDRFLTGGCASHGRPTNERKEHIRCDVSYRYPRSPAPS